MNSGSNKPTVAPPASEPSQAPPMALIAMAPAPAPAPVSAPAPALDGIAPPPATATESSAPEESSRERRSARGMRPPAAPTLQEALRWSIEARGGDLDQRALQPMSEEDRAFLMNAMRSLEGDGDSIKLVINHLRSPDTPADTLCALLDGLQEAAEDIDSAVGLRNLGGLDAFVSLATHASPPVQARALRLLGLAAQNNPPVQRHLATAGALDAIVPALRSSPDEEVQFRALSALSCLVRGHDDLAHRFLADNGAHLLHTYVARPPRMAAKALYLIRCLLQQRRDFASMLLAPAGFDALFGALPGASDDVWEQALSMLMLCPRSFLNPSHGEQLSSLLAARRAHVASRGTEAIEHLQTQANLLTAIERILLSSS